MAELIVERTYGEALYQAAKDLGKEAVFSEELAALQAVFAEEADFLRFLEAPTISVEEKENVVQEVLGGSFSAEIIRFLFVLIEKGRVRKFSKISAVYGRLRGEEEGIVPGTIESAVPLSEEHIRKFEEQTGKLLRKKVKLKNEVDKSLIGGVRIFADGKMIDASVKSRVSTLMETISREEANG